MAHLEGTISDFVQGDARELPRTVVVADILPDTLSKAWFTVKRRLTDSDADAIIQKTITAIVSLDGQIDNVGAADANGHLVFYLSAADTNSLAAGVRYFYDIKALSTGGAATVLEEGRITARSPVTRASS